MEAAFEAWLKETHNGEKLPPLTLPDPITIPRSRKGDPNAVVIPTAVAITAVGVYTGLNVLIPTADKAGSAGAWGVGIGHLAAGGGGGGCL